MYPAILPFLSLSTSMPCSFFFLSKMYFQHIWILCFFFSFLILLILSHSFLGIMGILFLSCSSFINISLIYLFVILKMSPVGFEPTATKVSLCAKSFALLKALRSARLNFGLKGRQAIIEIASCESQSHILPLNYCRHIYGGHGRCYSPLGTKSTNIVPQLNINAQWKRMWYFQLCHCSSNARRPCEELNPVPMVSAHLTSRFLRSQVH